MSRILSPCFHLIIACKEKEYAEKLGENFKRRKRFKSVNCVDSIRAVTEIILRESTLIVLDDKLPDLPDAEAAQRFNKQEHQWSVLILTETLTKEHIKHIMQQGYAGCAMRNLTKGALKVAIEGIYELGEYYMPIIERCCREQGAIAPQYLSSFEGRESEAFGLMCKRLSCREMARRMELKEITVRKYRSFVGKKVKAAGHNNVIECGRQFGLVED